MLEAALAAPAATAALLCAPREKAAATWATALVLAALEGRFAELRDSWSLFARRSGVLLRQALGGGAGASKRVADLQAAAAAALAS